jgi:hypothetical protein
MSGYDDKTDFMYWLRDKHPDAKCSDENRLYGVFRREMKERLMASSANPNEDLAPRVTPDPERERAAIYEVLSEGDLMIPGVVQSIKGVDFTQLSQALESEGIMMTRSVGTLDIEPVDHKIARITHDVQMVPFEQLKKELAQAGFQVEIHRDIRREVESEIATRTRQMEHDFDRKYHVLNDCVEQLSHYIQVADNEAATNDGCDDVDLMFLQMALDRAIGILDKFRETLNARAE